VEWSDVIYVKWLCFEFKRNEVKWSYGEVLRDKSAMHIRVTLHWRYLTVLWLFYLVCILYCGYFNLYCGCFNWFCNVLMCAYVDFVTCGFVHMCFEMCGCFSNMYTCIYCVLYCLYCVFVLFFSSIFVLFFCLY
jgi:hypothetical protein